VEGNEDRLVLSPAIYSMESVDLSDVQIVRKFAG